MQNSQSKKLGSKGESTKSLSDNSLSSFIEKEEFLTSKETERNESTDIVLKRVLENNFHHTRFNSLAKNVTDNRALDIGKETATDKALLTYAERVKKPTEQVIDLSRICSDLLAGKNRSFKMDTSPPNLCTNSVHTSKESRNHKGD